jgi:hydrogenase maturation factor
MTSSSDPYHCITCSDEGAELVVLQVDADRAMALCTDDAGAHSSVQIALVDDVHPGDVLLVHAGTALMTVRGQATA